MMNQIESWFFNVFVGKLAARAAVTIVGIVSSAAVQPILAQFGVNVQLDPVTMAGGMVIASQAAFEWIKAKRMANPASPAVQTDPTAPGGDKSAVLTVAAVVNAPK